MKHDNLGWKERTAQLESDNLELQQNVTIQTRQISEPNINDASIDKLDNLRDDLSEMGTNHKRATRMPAQPVYDEDDAFWYQNEQQQENDATWVAPDQSTGQKN